MQILSFLLSLSLFSFIIALVLTQKILSYTKGPSTKLQGRYVRAYRDTELVKTTLKDCRSDCDSFHARMYGEALRVAEKVNVQEAVPRFTNSSRQSHRSNSRASSASEYYKRSLTIPMLLDDRFNGESTIIVTGFFYYSSNRYQTADITPHTQSISNLLNIYAIDLRSHRNLPDTELDLWRNMWARNQERAQNRYAIKVQWILITS